MTTDLYAKIWRFADAPQHYREQSSNGGDEDYVVFIPDGLELWPLDHGGDYVPGWGHCDHLEVSGGTLLIFAHA